VPPKTKDTRLGHFLISTLIKILQNISYKKGESRQMDCINCIITLHRYIHYVSMKTKIRKLKSFYYAVPQFAVVWVENFPKTR